MPKKTAPKNKAKKTPLLKKEIIYLCSCCAVIVVLLLAAMNINGAVSERKVLGASAEIDNQELPSLSAEVAFWQNFLSRTPSYLDGWLELASLEAQLGDISAANYSLERAKQIDPNSEKLELVRASLEK